MTDLIVVSLEAWDGVWRRNQHLVSRLLAADPHLRVLFAEPPADPAHDVRHRRRPRFGSGPRQRIEVSDRLWTMQPTKALPRRLDPRADRRIAQTVMDAAARLNMTSPVLWINDPAAADVMRLTGWPTLYDMTDDWAVAERAARERARIVSGERELLTHAVQVVACSPELVRRKSPQRAAGRAPIVLVRNAVDTAAYQRVTERPADLPAGKVALYAGTLHSDRLDIELCVRTAEAARENASVVLVGPSSLTTAETRALRDAGAVLLGAKPHEQMPAYLLNADVLMVPHRVDAFTDSLDPIKLYEYQAAGRPVVSTAVAGFRDAGDSRIAIVEMDGFAAAVAQALRSDRRPAPLPAVADWSARAADLARVISKTTRETTR